MPVFLIHSLISLILAMKMTAKKVKARSSVGGCQVKQVLNFCWLCPENKGPRSDGCIQASSPSLIKWIGSPTFSIQVDWEGYSSRNRKYPIPLAVWLRVLCIWTVGERPSPKVPWSRRRLDLRGCPPVTAGRQERGAQCWKMLETLRKVKVGANARIKKSIQGYKRGKWICGPYWNTWNTQVPILFFSWQRACIAEPINYCNHLLKSSIGMRFFL